MKLLKTFLFKVIITLIILIEKLMLLKIIIK